MLLGFALYLALTPRGRAQWRSSGLWLAALPAFAGALPWLAWNFDHGFASLRYQLWERHAGGFAIAGLADHLRLQAIALTPPLYLALLAVLVALARRAARGDDRAALYASFSLAYLATFLLASPWADREHVSLHWPLPGYLPLLAALPGELRTFASGSTLRKVAAAAVPCVALVATALLHLELATGAFGTRERERTFGGWSAGVAAVRDALVALPKQPDGRWLVVADSYPLAGNLELRLGDAVRVEVLDHPKHAEYGRALQLRLWGLDESALAARAGETALVALDRDQSRSRAWPAWLARAESRFADWHEVAVVDADGRRGPGPRFWLYRGVVR
jgi:4-amino-4-deoxy-L-arabinose transferase-like glycosyltransferase